MATSEGVGLAVIEQQHGAVSTADFMPIFNIELAVQRKEQMREYINRILTEGVDYGVIPGTNKEKVLKKPGAEKLCSHFGLTPTVTYDHIIEDWSGDEHGGEPLFYYRLKVQLWRGPKLLGEGIGSCNSREKKYRFRGGDRLCPECGKPAIIKGKAEYGGGWVCFVRKGGCNAKFQEDDPAIVNQQTGQIINPDIYDVVNTCQKIAHKRALVAAVLIGTNVSDSFTQDLDEELEGVHREAERSKPAPQPAPQEDPRNQGAAMPQQEKPKGREVPEELKLVWEDIPKPGGAKRSLTLIKDNLLLAYPDAGGQMYSELLQKHKIKASGGNSTAAIWNVVLDGYDLIKAAPEATTPQEEGEPVGTAH